MRPLSIALMSLVLLALLAMLWSAVSTRTVEPARRSEAWDLPEVEPPADELSSQRVSVGEPARSPRAASQRAPRSTGTVTGRVLGPGGAPVGGAEVVAVALAGQPVVDRRFGPLSPLSQARTSARGVFTLSGVPPGETLVCAHARGMLWSVSDELEVKVGARSEVLLVLEPFPEEQVIELVVLDPQGAPVPLAAVESSYTSPNRLGNSLGNADEHGIYRHFTEADALHDFRVSDPEERWGTTFVSGLSPGTQGHQVRLGPPRFIELHVKTPAGAVQEQFGYGILKTGSSMQSMLGPHAHPGGVLRLADPGQEFSVRIDAAGYQIASLGPFPTGRAPEQLDVVLEPLPGIRGTVLAAGRPLAGATVGLYQVEEGRVLSRNGWRTRHRGWPACTGTSDAKGEFVLPLREPGSCFLRAEAPGWAAADMGPLRFGESLQASGLTIELGRGGSIEGTVLTAPGESPEGMLVGISRGDGFPRTQRSDASGRFRFDSLTPGRWLVDLREDGERKGSSSMVSSGPEDEAIPWNCEVAEGATTTFDLDLRERWERILVGRFLVNGRAAVGWSVSLSSMRDAEIDSGGTLDRKGRFRLPLRAGGECLLWLAPPESDGSLVIGVVLEAKETHWELDLPCGALSVHAPGFAEMDISREGPGMQFRAGFNPPPVESGTFVTAAFVPAGEITLRGRIPDSNDFVERTVTVTRGSTTRIEMQ